MGWHINQKRGIYYKKLKWKEAKRKKNKLDQEHLFNRAVSSKSHTFYQAKVGGYLVLMGTVTERLFYAVSEREKKREVGDRKKGGL